MVTPNLDSHSYRPRNAPLPLTGAAPVETARAWAREVKAAVDVIAEYDGILVRSPISPATVDVDTLMRHLIAIGVKRGKATQLAEEMIGKFMGDVGLWRSGGASAQAMSRLSSSALNERFHRDPNVRRHLWPLACQTAIHVLEMIKEDPNLFRLLLIDHSVPYGAEVHRVPVHGGLFRAKEVVFEKIRPSIPDAERQLIQVGMDQLLTEAADVVVGLIALRFEPAIAYRKAMQEHPMQAVRLIASTED